ncbi:MAG: F0F1 ATP synthase subunit delta [Chthoniobacterales bacterium]|jgi:F-type H+-transporting ATPase subunit delta|nr:F0F1 ATP synthase subunit delta [Chthoniobacterales bacterium]
MQIPKDAKLKARELFESSLDDSGRPDSAKALSIADLVVKAAPRHSIQILREFARLIRLETAKHHVVIESATMLEQGTRDSILKTLQDRDGGAVTVEVKVDPALIGGTRIRLGSEVWDASVLSRLLALNS